MNGRKETKIRGRTQFRASASVKKNSFLQIDSKPASAGEVLLKPLDPDVELLWNRRANQSRDSFLVSSATDPEGNLYAVGMFHGVVYLDMFRVEADPVHVSAGSAQSLFLVKMSPSGSYVWTMVVGTFDSDNSENAFKISVDGGGNIYLAGAVTGKLFFHGDLVFNEGTADAQGICNKTFVMKLDDTGVVKFVAVGSGGDSQNVSFAFDESTKTGYLAGSFDRRIQFGGFEKVLSTTQSEHAYVAKIDDLGNWLWLKSSYGNGTCVVQSVAVSASGRQFPGEADYAPSQNTTHPSNPSNHNTTQNTIPNTTSHATGPHCAYSPAVYVSGFYSGNVSFGKTHLSAQGGFNNMFAMKLSGDGNTMWTFKSRYYVDFLNTIKYDERVSSVDVTCESMGIDAADNVYLTGVVNGYVIFDDQNVVEATSDNLYVLKLSSDGQFVWVKTVSTNPPIEEELDFNVRLVTDTEGYSYLFGFYSYLFEIDGYSYTCHSGCTSAFLIELNDEGKCLWLQDLGGLNTEYNAVVQSPLASDNNGCVYLVGGYKNELRINQTVVHDCFRTNMVVLKFGRVLPKTVFYTSRAAKEGEAMRAVVTEGLVESCPDMKPGEEYYLTPRGMLSTSPVGNKYVGTATSSTHLYFDP